MGLTVFYTLLLTTSLFLADALLVLLFLQETLPSGMRLSRIPWAKANPIGSIRFYLSRKNKHRAYILDLVPVLFITLIVVSLLVSVFLYFSAVQYGLQTKEVFLFMACAGILIAIVQMASPVIFRTFATHKVLLFAIGCRCVSDPLLAFSILGWQAFLFLPFFAVSSLASKWHTCA